MGRPLLGSCTEHAPLGPQGCVAFVGKARVGVRAEGCRATAFSLVADIAMGFVVVGFQQLWTKRCHRSGPYNKLVTASDFVTQLYRATPRCCMQGYLSTCHERVR